MQQEISTILQKLAVLNNNPTPHRIDIDLMLEHTRKLYAQLLNSPQNDSMPEVQLVQTETIETELPDEPALTEEALPAIEIKLAELIQQLHVSTPQEPTLEDLIPEIPQQVVDAYTPIPPIANIPEEFIPQIIVEQQPLVASHTADTIVALPEPKTDTDIRRMIGINDKYQYMSELFGNDKGTYEIVLTKLNRFDSYADAVTWMDEVHTENRWDDEDPTVISFYDVMSQFFASR